MRPLLFVGKIVFIVSIVLAALLTGNPAIFIDVPGLGFMLAGIAAMTLISFSFREIIAAFKHAAGGDGEGAEIRKSAYFWEAAARNLFILGVLASIIGFVLVLGGLCAPKNIGPALASAFITTVYGVILGVTCGVPAFLLAKKADKQFDESVTREKTTEEGAKAFSVETVFGFILFILLNIWAMNSTGSLELFIHWQSLLVVIGGTAALATAVGGIRSGGSVTMGFACTGLIGALMGVIQLLHNIGTTAGLGASIAFIVISCFAATMGMVLVGFPLEDRAYKSEGKYKVAVFSRIAWYGFPLAVLMFLTLSMAMLVSIYSDFI
ncbi:MAG: hypothetical protein GY757_54765 [bacterium]|nr:hypothetical protein [bacterium]